MRNVARKEATQNETAKGKAAKKRCTSGGASKSCTFVFNFRQRSLKPNQSAHAGGPNWHETCSYPPTSPRSAVLYNNIFFHRQRACLIAPFIREEARFRSASLPPVPTTVAVCLRHHTLCSLARGTRKLGALWLRCGIKRQIGPRFFHPKGHIMFRGWLSSTKPGSLLINKTSRLFALIPQAAHMQESAAQGKNLPRGNFFVFAAKRSWKKKSQTHSVFIVPLTDSFISAQTWQANSGFLPWLRRKKVPLNVYPLCSLRRVKPLDDLHQRLGPRYCLKASLEFLLHWAFPLFSLVWLAHLDHDK